MLYLIEILHQTTTAGFLHSLHLGCILSKFYIKPQQRFDIEIPNPRCILSKFYIKPQPCCRCCIFWSVVSYRNSTSNHNISGALGQLFGVVSYRNSTSNHNDVRSNPLAVPVVSYRNSTSNHNASAPLIRSILLYLIEILHQTTTTSIIQRRSERLYLIEILHQTTTLALVLSFLIMLYLIEILHQTTTARVALDQAVGCILSKFYIKPQQRIRHRIGHSVVSYRNSTSNHNDRSNSLYSVLVVSYRNSTSNHNAYGRRVGRSRLYLIEILHQTTTLGLILIDKVLLTGCLPL